METHRKPGGLSKFLPSDREECGIIIRNAEGMLYVVKCPNRAERNQDYAIAESDVEALKKSLDDEECVVGFMHTHLEHHKCEPTDADFDGAQLHPEYSNLIYKPSTGEFCWYGSPEVGN